MGERDGADDLLGKRKLQRHDHTRPRLPGAGKDQQRIPLPLADRCGGDEAQVGHLPILRDRSLPRLPASRRDTQFRRFLHQGTVDS